MASAHIRRTSLFLAHAGPLFMSLMSVRPRAELVSICSHVHVHVPVHRHRGFSLHTDSRSSSATGSASGSGSKNGREPVTRGESLAGRRHLVPPAAASTAADEGADAAAAGSSAGPDSGPAGARARSGPADAEAGPEACSISAFSCFLALARVCCMKSTVHVWCAVS